MASVTSWVRLEPRTRDAHFTSVEARIADPLWLLGRQWQLGELRGEDAGTPVTAEIVHSVSRISRWTPSWPVPDAPALPDVPLDVLVESEEALSPDGDGGLQAALTAGRWLVELLGPGADLATLAATYGPLPPPDASPPDPEERRLRAMATGRLPDARRVAPALRAWRSGGPVPAGVNPADSAVVDVWLDWYARRPGGGRPPVTWRPTRLEHEFAIAAQAERSTAGETAGETVLVATSHGGRDLDWHAFDVLDGAAMGAAGDPAPTRMTLAAIPTRVSFPGMPVTRWWQLEDGDVDLAALRPAPEDLGRLLFTEFTLNYGNDFYWLPIDVPTGSLARVESLRVTTSFGDVIDVASTAETDAREGRVAPGDTPWTMFTPTRLTDGGVTGAAVTGVADVLVLLPLAGHRLHSEPLEDLLLSRDEMADVAWVLERAVPGPSGLPVDRHEVWQRSQPDLEQEPGVPHGPKLSYDLATEVAPFWLPMLNRPAPPGRNRSTVLELQPVRTPWGTLLADGLTLDEERLSRTGISLVRRRHRARAADGRTYVWTARRVTSGTGNSTSGLRFDVVSST